MTKVAEAILGDLDGIKYMSNDVYEWALTGGGPVTINRKELLQDLKNNIKEAKQEYRSMALFDHFLVHLEAEIPSGKDLDNYIETSPWELIELLKLLILKKEFKGKCPVCEG